MLSHLIDKEVSKIKQFKILLLLLPFMFFMQRCAPTNVEGARAEEVYTIANFTKIKIGMTYDEVLDVMKNPSSISGFNFKWLVYELNDGSKIKLGFLPSNSLMTMDIIDPEGRVFSLKQDEDD